MDTQDETKKLRKQIREIAEKISASPRKNRSRALAVTRLDEAFLWLGQDLSDYGFFGDAVDAPVPPDRD